MNDTKRVKVTGVPEIRLQKVKVEVDFNLNAAIFLAALAAFVLYMWDTLSDRKLADVECVRAGHCVAMPVYDDYGNYEGAEIRPAPEKPKTAPGEPDE